MSSIKPSMKECVMIGESADENDVMSRKDMMHLIFVKHVTVRDVAIAKQTYF